MTDTVEPVRDIERRLGRAAQTRYGREAAQIARRFGAGPALGELVDLVFACVDTPFGTLVVVATPEGVVRVSFEGVDETLDKLASTMSPRILEAPAALDDARRQIDEYFDAKRRRFELSLDWRLARGFGLRVLQTTTLIPYGEVWSYKKVAQGAGSPNGARAAGQALGANPIPVVVPCHRVVGAAGQLRGYAGGTGRKEYLLQLEEAHRAG